MRIQHVCGFVLFLFSCNTEVLSQVECPRLPLSVESESEARMLAKSLLPLQIQDESGDPCTPKVSGFLVFGNPLCLLSPSVSATVLAFSFLEGEPKPIAALFIAEYSESNHRELEQVLGQRYKRVEAPALAGRLGVHRELTAAFRSGDYLVSLEKPSDGMPGQWQSSVSHQREDRISFSRRNWNTCK